MPPKHSIRSPRSLTRLSLHLDSQDGHKADKKGLRAYRSSRDSSLNSPRTRSRFASYLSNTQPQSGAPSYMEPVGSSKDTISTASTRSTRSTQSMRSTNTELKAGRMYLDSAASSIPYALPIDLAETHRQIIYAQLTQMIYRAPLLSQDLLANPPLRVLELGCNTGWWSASCHQYFRERGHRVEFVGMDIQAPIGLDAYYEELGMHWEYVQHDVNEAPWPFEDGSFDLIMARNLILVYDPPKYGQAVEEYVRLLKPGGTVELYEHDLAIRSLLPKIRDRESEGLDELGLYPMADHGDFGPATNPFAVELNAWTAPGIKAGPTAAPVPSAPCPHIQAMFAMNLVDGCEFFDCVHAKSIAIPLNPGAMSWETTEGGEPRALDDDQAAIRDTALSVFVKLLDSLEPAIMAASGKSQTEWDAWAGQAKRNWLQEGGLQSGECLELGAWSMRKTCQ